MNWRRVDPAPISRTIASKPAVGTRPVGGPASPRREGTRRPHGQVCAVAVHSWRAQDGEAQGVYVAGEKKSLLTSLNEFGAGLQAAAACNAASMGAGIHGGQETDVLTLERTELEWVSPLHEEDLHSRALGLWHGD